MAEQAPLSPAFGLPLYRALLQNPPRVDPYLGPLPPADLEDRQLTPLGIALPTLPGRSATRTGTNGAGTNGTGTNGTGTNGTATNGAAANGAGQAAADLRAGRERARRNRPPAATGPDRPDHGRTQDPRHDHPDRTTDADDTDDDIDGPQTPGSQGAPSAEPVPRPARPRRRPAVIDLTRDDDRRSPFG